MKAIQYAMIAIGTLSLAACVTHERTVVRETPVVHERTVVEQAPATVREKETTTVIER